MTQVVNQDLAVSAAQVVASGSPLYPPTSRQSAAQKIKRTPSDHPATKKQREEIKWLKTKR
jgi:hypothetical protein